MDIIRNAAKNAWNNRFGKTPDELTKDLLNSFRNLDYDENIAPTTGLVATILDYGSFPNLVLHVILGVVSDVEMTVKLEMGGRIYGEPIHLKPMVPTAILTDSNKLSWPIINTAYHMIKLVTLDNKIISTKNCNIYGLGIRLKTNILDSIQTTKVPGLCVFKDGMCLKPDEYTDELPEWLPIA